MARRWSRPTGILSTTATQKQVQPTNIIICKSKESTFFFPSCFHHFEFLNLWSFALPNQRRLKKSAVWKQRCVAYTCTGLAQISNALPLHTQNAEQVVLILLVVILPVQCWLCIQWHYGDKIVNKITYHNRSDYWMQDEICVEVFKDLVNKALMISNVWLWWPHTTEYIPLFGLKTIYVLLVWTRSSISHVYVEPSYFQSQQCAFYVIWC